MAVESACHILAHLEDHVGERVTIHGTITGYEHGMYLNASAECGSRDSVIRVRGNLGSYAAAGGKKGRGISGTVEGTLVKSTRGPQDPPAPTSIIVLTVDSVKWDSANQR